MVPKLRNRSAIKLEQAAANVATKIAANECAPCGARVDAARPADAPVKARAGVYTIHRRWGGLRMPRFPKAPTTSAARGPNATAVNTKGRNEIDDSIWPVSLTLERSVAAATRTNPPSTHQGGRW